MSDSVKLLITQSVTQLITMQENLCAFRKEIDNVSSQLPEHDMVLSMFGAGKVLGSQLMAEIGDTRRFHNRKAITAYAGLDASPYQSGAVNIQSRSISKKGFSALRKTLFQIMTIYIQKQPVNEHVYNFLDKKRSEGKPYKVYMMAASNKFLRTYYAKVNLLLGS